MSIKKALDGRSCAGMVHARGLAVFCARVTRGGWAARGLLMATLLLQVGVVIAGTVIPLPDGTVYESTLPVVYIDTKNGEPVKEKDTVLDATMKIVGNNVFGGFDKALYDGAITIKGRGNSTWFKPKKPYKIKLDKKTDLFGFGKNKHWVLLANYFDVSLLRNKFAYDLSAQLGMVSMQSTWVDVVLNGTFLGNYQFCEHVRVGSSRIDIFDWDDVIGDGDEKNLSHLTDDPSIDITGGYLFELSEEYDEISKFKTQTGLKVMVKTPEYIRTNAKMFNYVKAYWQGLEESWLSPNKRDSAGVGLGEYADINSMVSFWLVNEIMCNGDAAKKSRYAYKDVRGKMVFGPVWDFDWVHEIPDLPYLSQWASYWRITRTADVAGIFKYWLTDAEFRRKAMESYGKIRGYLADAVSPGGLIDQYLDYIGASGDINSSMWSFNRGFRRDAEVMRTLLAYRIQWLDARFANEQELERSTSIMSGVSVVPKGTFTGTKKVEYKGRVLNGDTPVGLLALKAGKANAKGVCNVSGTYTGLDGKNLTIRKFKMSKGRTPALSISKIKGPLLFVANFDDTSFAGTLGAWGIESTDGVRKLADGKFKFEIMGDFPKSVKGFEVDVSRLPKAEPITVKGRKCFVRKVSQGNLSNLKLSFNNRKGTFSGRFKVYAAKGKKKKVLSAKVVGIITGGCGYGQASISNVGTFKVMISPVEE